MELLEGEIDDAEMEHLTQELHQIVSELTVRNDVRFSVICL